MNVLNGIEFMDGIYLLRWYLAQKNGCLYKASSRVNKEQSVNDETTDTTMTTRAEFHFIVERTKDLTPSLGTTKTSRFL